MRTADSTWPRCFGSPISKLNREIATRSFDVATDAPQEKLDQLLKLTERYCVVYQTIAKGPPVAISLNRA